MLAKSPISIKDCITRFNSCLLQSLNDLQYSCLSLTKHKPVFHVQVKIKSSKSIDGIGSSKKLAEQDAATSLLRKMNLL